MNIQEIEQYIIRQIRQSLAGGEIENEKVDCKRAWYQLRTPEGKENDKEVSSFLKDTSSIANTYGADGFIIIGYDEKEKSFHQVMFTDTGLKDSAELNQLLYKHINDAFSMSLHSFEVDGHHIQVLHIPPSFEKPHIIKSLKRFNSKGEMREELHRILVRNGSLTREATKQDIERIFWDRRNIPPQPILYISFDLYSMKAKVKPGAIVNDVQSTENIYGTMDITFENLGHRAIPIKSMFLFIAINETAGGAGDSSGGMLLRFGDDNDHSSAITIIPPNQLIHLNLRYASGNFNILPAKFAQARLEKFTDRLESIIIQGFDMVTTNNAIIDIRYQKTEVPRYLKYL